MLAMITCQGLLQTQALQHQQNKATQDLSSVLFLQYTGTITNLPRGTVL